MTDKKLRSGIHLDTKEISKDVGNELGIDFDESAIELVGEMIYKKILMYGSDLEAFCKHAKRSTITTDDVKLLCRNNTSLKNFVEQECPTARNEVTNLKNKRKVTALVINDD
ncbi:cortistatin [Holotrichia oblita]|uniref:Cortistatin n=1 Tax=Holotrichia oblita TaxID=644536 RepID=A0ACB9T6C9_HOLOL|nr:cortistatin [Holotrichia oblita]